MSREARGPLYRICAEFMAPRELAAPSVVKLLSRFRVAPMIAFHPGSDGEMLEALAPFLDAGLPACAWPLLADDEGYWPSESNVDRFATRVESLLAAAGARGMRIPWLAVDLEPRYDEIAQLRRGRMVRAMPAIFAYGLRNLDAARRDRATRAFAALHKKMAAAGTRGLAIAYPMVSADFGGGSPSVAIQGLCEAPLRCGWDRVAIMTYGSMLAGYLPISFEDARWYGYRALGDLSRSVGARAGAFVGLVGQGKLGDEPAYDDPEELARDAAAARAAGAGEISLFALEGILATAKPEAWLSALTEGPPAHPPRRWRGELLHRSITSGAAIVDVVQRLSAHLSPRVVE
jgi:hypothetical protein